MKFLIALFVKFPIRVAQGVYRAFVLTQLWAWFVIPTFGLRTLPLAMSYGLLLTVTLFYTTSHADLEARKRFADAQKEHGNAALFISDILTSFTLTSLCWGLGALVHHFA